MADADEYRTGESLGSGPKHKMRFERYQALHSGSKFIYIISIWVRSDIMQNVGISSGDDRREGTI
jgi:hypothetical protein